jgi:hypothetical protein
VNICDQCKDLKNITGVFINVYVGGISTYIVEHAFENCVNLKQVKVNAAEMLYICSDAFKGCTSLCSVELYPNDNSSFNTIESNAFDGAGSPTGSLLFQIDYMNIKDYAFKNLATQKVMLNLGYCTVGSRVFEGSPITKLGVYFGYANNATTYSSSAFDGLDTTACGLFDMTGSDNLQIYDWQGLSWCANSMEWGE